MFDKLFHKNKKADETVASDKETLLSDNPNEPEIDIKKEPDRVTFIIPGSLDELNELYGDSVYAATLSADGSTLAVKSDSKYGFAWLFDTRTRKLLTMVPIDVHAPYEDVDMYLSASGDLLATSSCFVFAIARIEQETTSQNFRISTDADDCFFAAFHPDGKHIAYAIGDFTHAIVQDPIESEENKMFCLDGRLTHAQYSPNGKSITLFSQKMMEVGPLGSLVLANTENNEIILECECFDMFCYSSDGSKLFFCASVDGKPVLTMISAETGEQVWNKPLIEWPDMIHFSTDGSNVMVGTREGVHLYSATSGEIEGEVPMAKRLAAFSTCGRYSAITTADQQLLIHNDGSNEPVFSPGAPKTIKSLEFYGDSGILYVKGEEFDLVLDVKSMSPLCRVSHKKH